MEMENSWFFNEDSEFCDIFPLLLSSDRIHLTFVFHYNQFIYPPPLITTPFSSGGVGDL